MLWLRLLYSQFTRAQVFAFWSNFADQNTSKWVTKTCILHFGTSLYEGLLAAPFHSYITGNAREKKAEKELAILSNLDLTLGQ